MPRETIFTPYPQDPTVGPIPFQMQVGWNRDMDVQVGISTPDERHLVDYIYGSDSLRLREIGKIAWEKIQEYATAQGPAAYLCQYVRAQSDFSTSDQEDAFYEGLGRQILDAVTGSTPFGESVWWHPGRKQINDLIRLLRKARDAAFGRDE